MGNTATSIATMGQNISRLQSYLGPSCGVEETCIWLYRTRVCHTVKCMSAKAFRSPTIISLIAARSFTLSRPHLHGRHQPNTNTRSINKNDTQARKKFVLASYNRYMRHQFTNVSYHKHLPSIAQEFFYCSLCKSSLPF